MRQNPAEPRKLLLSHLWCAGPSTKSATPLFTLGFAFSHFRPPAFIRSRYVRGCRVPRPANYNCRPVRRSVMLQLSRGLLVLTVLLGLATVSAQTSGPPVSQDLQVELATSVKAKKAKAGDAVSAVTVVPVTLAKGVVIPAGSKVLGHVRQVEADSAERHTSSISLSFEEVVVKKGQTVPLNCFIRAGMMPALRGVSAQGMDQGQTIAPTQMPSRGGMSGGTMGGGMMGGGMGGGMNGMGGGGMGGSSASSSPPALPSAPQPQETPKPVAAHNGEVIGMRGVELQVSGADHLSTFRSTHKNLELDEGLQLMLVVQQ
jgi:hypothetical protein